MRFVVLVAAIAAAPLVARAGNDEGVPLGDDAALAGMAVAAIVSDGSSLFYNPAGLARGTRDQIDVSATATLVRFYRLPTLLSTTAGARAVGNFVEVVAVPAAVSYVRGLRGDLTLGLAVFAPESLANTIDVSLDEPSGSFRVSTTSRESTYVATAGLGWRTRPCLRLGASLGIVYLSQLGMADAVADYQLPDGSEKLFTLAELFSLSGIGAVATVGLQWEPRPGLHIGLAVRAPVLLLFTAISGSTVVTTSGTMPADIEVEPVDLSDVNLWVHQLRPARIRLGAAWAWGKSWLSLEGDVQPPLTVEDLGLHRNFTWNLRAGGLVAVAAQTWVGFGAYTDRSPDSAARGLLASRIDYYGATFGLRFDHPHALGSGERAKSLVFSTTIGLRYAFGTGEVGGLRFQSIPTGSEIVEDRPVKARIHELGLHLGSTVYF